MNFGKFDAIMLLTMLLAVISMSFVFPAIGLTNEDTVDSNEIPSLQIDSDRFDIVGDLPDRPSTTDSGTLTYRADGYDDRFIWVDHDGTNGLVSAEIYNENASDSPPITVQLQQWDSGNSVQLVTGNLTEVGDRTELTVDNTTEWTVRYELTEIRNEGTEDFEAQVQFEVVDSPGGDGFLGSLIGAGEVLASTLAWVGLVFYWFSVSLFEIAGNVIGMVYDVTAYFISLITFLFSSYTGIVSAAQGFAQVFVAIPGAILSVMLGKIVVIGVGLLPTT